MPETKMSPRETLTNVVKHLMIDHNEKHADLAEQFKIGSSYFSKKVLGGHWSLDDLDVLAAHYGYDAADLLQGYRHLRNLTDPVCDPTPVRERITEAVRHLMLDHSEKVSDLDDLFYLAPRGFTEKINLSRWTIDNLDVLADHYGVQPHDIVAGYDHLTRVGTCVQPPART